MSRHVASIALLARLALALAAAAACSSGDSSPLLDAGAPADAAADATAQPCPSDRCLLDILPRESVVPLAAAGTVVPTLALVAVRDEGLDLPPLLLTTQASWRSSDPGVATVDAEGRVTPVAAGKVSIHATHAGREAVATVIVSGAFHDRSVEVDSASRSYQLFVPDSYDGSSAPLVLAFHGGGGTGRLQMNVSQMNRAAAAHGFIVGYPNGSGAIQTWNGGACCGAAARDGVDDIELTRAIFADIASDFAIDGKQVFATGFSNGAILSHRLACEASDLIAAIAPISGGLNLGGDFPVCAPNRSVPILMIHGTTDRNYPLEGGVGTGSSGVDFYPVEHPSNPSSYSDWQAINGAAGEAVVYDEGVVTCRRSSPATTDGADVEICVIDPDVTVSDAEVVYDGGGHAVAAGARGPTQTSDLPHPSFDAAEAIWQFFAAHPLP